MKYRIRDKNTGDLLPKNEHALSFRYFTGAYFMDDHGVIYDVTYEPMHHLKAEFEVAPGFYEGDHVIKYDMNKQPIVYYIANVYELESLCDDYDDERVYASDLMCNYEVIKCR